MISKDKFFALPIEEVARIVRTDGPKVCVFPNDGTRRWFALEHAENNSSDPLAAYLDTTGQRHVEIYRMFFDHGIDTVLAPIFGGDTLKRGDEYTKQVAINGLLRLAEHPDFLHLYDDYQVRVGFYGDYRKHLAGIPDADRLIAAFDTINARTRGYQHRRLFFGLFANDATETMAELAIHVYQKTGTIPDRQRLVELYYGEYIEPASFFIGFEKFCAFDYPLLATGMEDLYFMVAPSSYLGEKQLRGILFDHLFTRRGKEPEYASMSPTDFEQMRSFYAANMDNVLGVGVIQDGIWYPVLHIGEKDNS
jgi:adenosine tuberculosinyltransferase